MKELSKQENKVAHLAANGLLEKEIADKLYISPKTVHTHLRNIRSRIGARNMADLTRMYILSLPKASDVLKVLLFLVIQFYMVYETTTIERGVRTMRTARARKGRSRRDSYYDYECYF